jgi:hypothetical protein
MLIKESRVPRKRNKKECFITRTTNCQDSLVIYSYTYPSLIDQAKSNNDTIQVKVGETTQGLKEGYSPEECARLRMKEQGDANEAERKILIGAWKVNKSKIPKDKTLHKPWEIEGLKIKKEERGKGTEWFKLGYSIEECKTKIENTIESFNQSTGKSFTIRTAQKRTLDEAIKIYDSTDKDRVNIVANLAPRFGKTLWILMLFNEFGKKVLVLPSAVLSTHTSFKEDIKNFQGFEDVEYITTHKNPNYAKQIEIALSKNKRVVVTVSLFTKNEKDLKYIRDMPNNDKFLCVDEGDFGAWTDLKRKILEYLMPNNDTGKYCFVSMSGTNIARMVTGSEYIDGVITSTYMELELTEKGIVRRKYVDLKLSNMDKYVKDLTKDDYFSWTKVTANPYKSENFLKEFISGLTGNTNNRNYNGLNLSNMMEEEFNCGMMFFSGTNKNINKIAANFRKVIPKWEIIVLNSEYTSNKEAEDVVKNQINLAKLSGSEGVLILSNTMGSRSFSIPEIQATILCYDKGGIDQTIQKSSRCLTPGINMNGDLKEYGYIVSCSMNPNRTTADIISDSNLISEAAIQSEISGEDYTTTIKKLLNNVSILSTDEYGNRVNLVEDEEAMTNLIKELSSAKELIKVASALCNPDIILNNPDMLKSFLGMSFGKAGEVEKKEVELPEGNTFAVSSESESDKKISGKKGNSNEDIIRKNIKTLVYSASMLVSMVEGRTYRECLKNIDNDIFKSVWTIDKDVALSALDVNALPEKWLDVIVCATDDLIKSGKILEWHELPTFGKIPHLGISDSDEIQVWFDTLKPLNLKDMKIASLATNHGKEISALIKLGVEPKNITVIDEGSFSRVWEAAGINVNVVENLLEIPEMKKFDVLLANPPYKGKARLHQQFFNTACEELTKDGGYTIFLQPASTYLTQKEVKTKHEKTMIGNILKYKTNVKILPRDIFKNAVSENELAMTSLNKIENTTGKLKSLIYKDGKKYENVGLEDINIHSLDNKIFRKIKEKYEKYILQNGSLNDSTYYSLKNPINNICGLPKLRSNIGTKHFFTFLPNPIEKTKYYTTKISEKHDFGIRVKNNKQIKNVYSYIQTFCARFGLALLKINANNHMGEFRKVPLVDFDKEWTDKLLIKELKLTQEEFKIIVDTLGHYYG